jgi:hypothetical protein
MTSISTDDDLNSSIVEEGIAGGIIAQLCGNELVLDDWKGYYFSSNCTKFNDEYGIFKIIKKVLNGGESKPNLVAMAGFSFKSFCGSTKVIVENLDKIQEKFNCVYVICFTDEVQKKQTDACKSRDANITEKPDTLTEEELKDKAVREQIFKPETDLNDKLGNVVDKLIRCAGITNVHLLGKCAGGGVAIHTFTKSNIYQALYLAVPASPTNVEHLKTIDLSGKKIIIAWDKRDAYPFKWGKSNQELASYEETLMELKANHRLEEFIVEEFNNGETDPKKYHEIPDQLFDLI